MLHRLVTCLMFLGLFSSSAHAHQFLAASKDLTVTYGIIDSTYRTVQVKYLDTIAFNAYRVDIHFANDIMITVKTSPFVCVDTNELQVFPVDGPGDANCGVAYELYNLKNKIARICAAKDAAKKTPSLCQ